MQHWHENEVPWCLYALERDHNFHLARALSQRADNAGINSYEWMVGKDEYVDKLEDEHKNWVDSFGKHIWIRPKGGVGLEESEEWEAQS